MKIASLAIIISTFNKNITDKLMEGATQRVNDKNMEDDKEFTSIIFSFRVPGAIEIPVTAQRIAKTGKYHAIVCLGAIIRGETSHYDTVCQQVSYGCQRVALDNELPVIFGVLTTENEEQALDRVGGKHGHKGIEAIDTTYQMIELFEHLERYKNFGA